MAAESPKPELFRQTQLKVTHNPADYETQQVGGHGPPQLSNAVATSQKPCDACLVERAPEAEWLCGGGCMCYTSACLK
jgi:hypothetical protein